MSLLTVLLRAVTCHGHIPEAAPSPHLLCMVAIRVVCAAARFWEQFRDGQGVDN